MLKNLLRAAMISALVWAPPVYAQTALSALGTATTTTTADYLPLSQGAGVSGPTCPTPGVECTRKVTLGLLLGAPIPIGNTTPNTGAFSTLFAGDGAASAPGMTFTNDHTGGLYRYAGTIWTPGLQPGNYPGGSVGLVANGFENITLGNGGDVLYQLGGARMQNGSLAVRSQLYGCDDVAVGLSVVVNASSNARASVSSGCNTSSSYIGTYGNSTDDVSLFVDAYPRTFTTVTGVTTFANNGYGLKGRVYAPGSTTFPVSALRNYMYMVLTNNTQSMNVAGMVYGFDPAGTWIDTQGWYVSQGGGTAVDPTTFSTSGGYTLYINPSSGTFSTNIRCTLNSGTTIMALNIGQFCNGVEYDMANNTGAYNFATDQPHMAAISIINGGSGAVAYSIEGGGSHFGTLMKSDIEADFVAGQRTAQLGTALTGTSVPLISGVQPFGSFVSTNTGTGCAFSDQPNASNNPVLFCVGMTTGTIYTVGGLNLSGGAAVDTLTVSNRTGTAASYACFTSSGQLVSSGSACP